MKVRRVGKELVLQVPASFGVQVGQEFSVRVLDDGSLIYHPVGPNIFEDRTHKNADLRPSKDELPTDIVGREEI